MGGEVLFYALLVDNCAWEWQNEVFFFVCVFLCCPPRGHEVDYETTPTEEAADQHESTSFRSGNEDKDTLYLVL